MNTEKLTAGEVERAAAVLRRGGLLGLPTETDVPLDELMRYVAHDKKRHDDSVNLVVPERLGAARVRRVPLVDLGALVAHDLEGAGL